MDNSNIKYVQGLFLSKLSAAILEAVEKDMNKTQLIKLLTNVVNENYEIGHIDLSSDYENTNENLNQYRKLENDVLKKLNVILPWSSFNKYEKGIVGSPYDIQGKKRVKPAENDPTLKNLAKKIDFSKKNIIESGCFEGHHSIALAKYGANVYSFDSRIENVIKSMVRAWIYAPNSKINFEVIDLEKKNPFEIYSKVFSKKNPLHLYHCRGVIYHLSNPIDYVINISRLVPKFIYFHTQLAKDEDGTLIKKTDYGELRMGEFREKNQNYAPFAGMNKYALRFTKNSLIKILTYLGYNNIEILMFREERNGPRIELIASKI